MTSRPASSHRAQRPPGFFALCLAASAILAPIQGGFTATQRLEKELTLPADQIRELDIVADEGELEINGSESATSITVVALISVKGDISDQEFADFLDTWMDLDLYRHGWSAELIAKISAGSLITYQPRIDLQITMPARMDLAVRDGGGTLQVSGVEGDVEIIDTSGKIILQKINGNIEIQDGAGSLEISDSTGDIELHDLTGWVRLTRVDGSMFMDKTSGNVRIDGLTGDLVVEGESAIDIETANLGGQVRRRD